MSDFDLDALLAAIRQQIEHGDPEERAMLELHGRPLLDAVDAGAELSADEAEGHIVAILDFAGARVAKILERVGQSFDSAQTAQRERIREAWREGKLDA